MRIALLLPVMLLACSAPLPWTAGTPARVEENIVHTTLDNGLNVIVAADRSAPVVALMVWVRTGSADEKPEEAGMAHVFEHMLFKGTERRAVGEIASSVEAAGGNINAFTSFDMTVYHITMASRDASVGIDVLSDAIRNSTFDPDELSKETEVILEEIRRGDDNPGRVLFQEMLDLGYKRHPYRLPVIGTKESVVAFGRDDLLAFYRHWYVPNNMTFVVVGDVDRAAVVQQIRQAFDDAPARPDLAHPREPEPERSAPAARVVRRPFQQTLIGVTYPGSAFADADTPYLDLLAIVLGAGDSSRLYRNVQDQQRLVHTVSASAYTPRDPGIFYVDAALDPERIESALRAIGGEIQRLRAFGPSEVELERARINLLSSEVHEKETVQGQARKLGYYETLAGGLEAEKVYLERIRSATPEDLKRVAVRYLVPERASVVALLPEGTREELDEAALLEAYQAPERQSAQGTELPGGIHSYRLPNGLRVLVKPSHSVPLVSMRLAFLGGQLAESEETQGISSFLAEMLERGTESRSSAQISAEVEGIAGEISGFSGRNTFGFTASFLRESLDTGLELFADLVLHPSFPAEEIEKLEQEWLAAIVRREDNLASKAFDLFAEALYPNHPYRFPTIGTEKSIRALERQTLVDYYESLAAPSNGVLAIVGDVEPDAAVEAIASLLSGWSGADVVELPVRAIPEPPTEPREIAIDKHKQQVHIVMGFRGLALGDPDQEALDVLTQILSGQGGRLFMELRDRRSLAYSVTAFSIEGVDPGSFGVYIASAPDKLEESLEGLRTELERLLADDITPAEVERAKAYLIGTEAVSLQRFGAQASLLALDELYGLGASHYLDYADRIEAVGVADLRRVAERLILLDRPVVAMVR